MEEKRETVMERVRGGRKRDGSEKKKDRKSKGETETGRKRKEGTKGERERGKQK